MNHYLKWISGFLFAAAVVPAWGLDGFGTIRLESYTYESTGESTGQRIAIPNAGAAVVDPGFDIVLNYTVAPTASQAAAFSAAEAFWESTILGYQETVGGANTVEIQVDLSPIDGVGGVLGQAGPTSGVVTPNFLYATNGAMQFDSADVAGLETNGSFNEVILHEMGHVIGIAEPCGTFPTPQAGA